MRRLVVDTMPCDHDIASATWTRQAVAELMAKCMGIDLTLQGGRQVCASLGLDTAKASPAVSCTRRRKRSKGCSRALRLFVRRSVVSWIGLSRCQFE
jgi:hypothetical protein